MSSSSSSTSTKGKKKPNKAVDKTVGQGTPAAGSEHGSFVKREPEVNSSGALDKKAPQDAPYVPGQSVEASEPNPQNKL